MSCQFTASPAAPAHQLNAIASIMNHAAVWLTLFGISLSIQAAAKNSETSDIEKYARIFLKDDLFEDISLSPDSSHLAMIVHRDSRDVLATMDLATGKAQSASGRPGQRIYSYDWVDGDTLAFCMSLWDYYNAGLYYVDEDLQDFTLIGTPEVAEQLGMVFSKEMISMLDPLPHVKGKMLLMDKTLDEQYPEVYVYDHLEGKATERHKNKDKAVAWECDLSGQIRLVSRLTEPGESEIYHRENEDSEWTHVPLPQDTHVLGFDITGNRIYVSYPDETGTICFQIFDLQKMEFLGRPVSHSTYSASPRLLRDVQSGALIGVIYSWDKPKVVYFDAVYKNLHNQLTSLFPDALCVIMGQTQKNTVLIKVFSDTRPTKIYELDLAAGMTMKLILNQADWIPEGICQPMEPILFTAGDGTEIHGYLTRARTTPNEQGPTIMYIHGGPHSRDSWAFDSMVQYLSNLGYHVIQVNYRGSSGFNESYSIRELDQICQLSTADIADAARWAVAQNIADADRIAILGGSYGGYAALAGAAFEPDLYKVAIGFAGVYDFDRQLKSFYRAKGSWRDWIEPYIGDIKNNPDAYHDLSPVNFADRIKAKVLLIHGGADNTVSIAQSKIMAKALRKAGSNPQVETSAWGVHGFADEDKRIEYGILVGEFLKQNL